MKPRLMFGAVMHERLRPAANRFVYPVFFLQAPLARLAELRGPLFSLDRWNLFSLHRRDHGPRDGGDLEPWIRALLARQGLAVADGEVVLQAFPRVLGYVFNPVSFWLCHDRGGALRAVLAEVNNTFGERHNYLVARPDGRPIRAGDALEARKVFHVSPFLPVEGRYRFRFAGGSRFSAAFIDYEDAEGLALRTSISGRPVPLDSRGLLRAFFGYPAFTLGVVARIHWQALKLWWKGVPFFSKPCPPVPDTTR
jgi:hypothetical protein